MKNTFKNNALALLKPALVVTFAALLIACQEQPVAQEIEESIESSTQTAQEASSVKTEAAVAPAADVVVPEPSTAKTPSHPQYSSVPAQQLDESKFKPVATQMKPSTGDKIEVAELFWFGCGHCFALEPSLKKWKANIPDNAEFVKVPAIFSSRWEFHAKAFYTMQALSVPDEAYEEFFRSIHINRKQINTIGHLIEFLAKFDKSATEVESSFNSFQVDSNLRAAKKITLDSGATGVPAMIVDGKYITTQQQAGGQEAMFITVNQLVEKAAAER